MVSANPQQASGRKYKVSWAGVLNISFLASPGISLVLGDKRQDHLLLEGFQTLETGIKVMVHNYTDPSRMQWLRFLTMDTEYHWNLRSKQGYWASCPTQALR